MALNLDNRQRAMLQEMGITVWSPKPAAAAAAAAIVTASVPARDMDLVQRQAVAEAAVAMPAAAPAPQHTQAPVHIPAAAPLPTPEAAPVLAAPSAAASDTDTNPQAAQAWRIAPAVQAFPQASGGSADDAWLVIWECASPHAPLEGDSGKLLGNMLRALRLHHSPHVWIAGMQRPGHEALPVAGLPSQVVAWQDLPTGLPHTITHTRPARILLLGMHAARAVLNSQEALGRLRAQLHQVHSIPTVVSYDPAYLLRSPHAKPAAWSDLCRAHALRPPPHN